MGKIQNPTDDTYRRGVKPLRNLRIVWLKNERKMSFGEIKELLESEGHKISRQGIANIYKEWKYVKFRWEDDHVIIH